MVMLPEISAAFPVLCLVSCFHESLPNITRTTSQGCFHWQQPSLVVPNLWIPEANEEASLNDHRNPIENHQRLTLNDMADFVADFVVQIFFVESVHEISAIQVVHPPWHFTCHALPWTAARSSFSMAPEGESWLLFVFWVNPFLKKWASGNGLHTLETNIIYICIRNAPHPNMTPHHKCC